jgi:hypothetical protein
MHGLHATLGKDAFHRVPDFARNGWDAVERVPTGHTPSRATIFGARNLAGVAGHARRSNKTTTKERKVVNV